MVTIKRNEIGVFLNNQRVTCHHEVFNDPYEHARRCEQVLNNGWMILHVWERYDSTNGESLVLLFAKPEHDDIELIVDLECRDGGLKEGNHVE